MRKLIVVAGLALVAAAFTVLMLLDTSLSLIISGSTPTANRQFAGGNFNFVRGSQLALQSSFSTIYYRFTAYLVAIVGVVVTSLGTILRKSPAKDKEVSEDGDVPPYEESNVASSEETTPSFSRREADFHVSSRTRVRKSDRNVVIRLDSVVKTYSGSGIATPALRGVSLDITEGEFMAIVGPSGSGKSTLMNMIGALDKPTSGKVLINGIDISKLNDKELAELRNKNIGLIFQSFNLIHRMNALQNVEFPLAARNMRSRERDQLALKAIQLVGLGDKAKRVPSKLSGGEQQRVAVARALVTEPPILLGDEPTGNLDTKNTKSITDLLHHLNKTVGKTIVIITHNMEIANEADRIIYIRDGLVERDEYTIGGIKQ